MPQTESYAKQWWEEFTKHVIVGPVLVFFLWLAFATLGNGKVAEDIGISNNFRQGSDVVCSVLGKDSNSCSSGQKVSISEISTWENMEF
jgi:hypothetical protein